MEQDDIQEFAQEWHLALERAFQSGAEFIIFDGQTARSEALRNSWHYGIEKGYLDVREYKEDQYFAYHGYWTDKAKKELS